MAPQCSIPECAKPPIARGWCTKHHQRWYKHGSVYWEPPTIVERFWSKVEFTETCWLWTGFMTGRGYGEFWPARRAGMAAHRYAYEFCVGPIPEGFLLDHLCHTRDESCTDWLTCPHRVCVRPEHLEPVTNHENILRGRRWAKKTT